MIRRLRCTSSRHRGNRMLPEDSFGLDASKATGRTPDCRECRRQIRADVNYRRKLAREPHELPRTKRMCAEDGCCDPPAARGTNYCAAHKKRGADGRRFRPPRRSESRETFHDLALKVLAKGW